MRWWSVILAAGLLAPLPACAQDWRDYDYPDAHFAVQFPAEPTIRHDIYEAATGARVPAVIYSVRQGPVIYTITVADFSGTAIGDDTAIADTVKAFAKTGEIKLDVDARINRQYGHELSVVGRDGSRSIVGIFFFNHHLYQLDGMATGADPAASSAGLIRFQQSLQFPYGDGD